MCDAMKAFHLLMKVHKVQDYRAYATSAMREAYSKKSLSFIQEKQYKVKLLMVKGSCNYSINRFKSFIKIDQTYLFCSEAEHEKTLKT
jgi:exopolyphosphatase/guanosine-5'-triphosphate,3'-diphosphate pyrophosphatase